MDDRFKHHAPKGDETIRRHQAAREAANDMFEAIEILSWNNSREKSVAITKLEECMFWLNAEIARNQ